MRHLKHVEQIRQLHAQPCTPDPEKRVYKSHAQADDIVIDAWSRGFDVTQCEEELQAQGFLVSRTAILEAWVVLDEELARDM